MSGNGEFTGEVADRYAKYRRGYRAGLFDLLAAEFSLGDGSRVLELGCGTAQLAIPPRPAGGIAVIANGTPAWPQDTAHDDLEHVTGTTHAA